MSSSSSSPSSSNPKSTTTATTTTTTGTTSSNLNADLNANLTANLNAAKSSGAIFNANPISSTNSHDNTINSESNRSKNNRFELNLTTTQKFGIASVVVALGIFIWYRSQGRKYKSKERTLAIIKPDAYDKKEDIKARITREGLHIIAERRVNLTREQASLFYAEHSEKKFYDTLLDQMTSGPVLVLGLEGKNAIKRWRQLMGSTDPAEAKQTSPESIRARYGQDIGRNAVHGSDSQEAAARELVFFFDMAFDDNTI